MRSAYFCCYTVTFLRVSYFGFIMYWNLTQIFKLILCVFEFRFPRNYVADSNRNASVYF